MSRIDKIIRKANALFAVYDTTQVKKIIEPLLEEELTLNHRVEILCLMGRATFKWESVEYLKEALKLDPNNAAALEALGWTYQLLNKNKECAENLIKANELKPNKNTYWAIGESLVEIDEIEKGIYWLKRAHENEPNNANILFGLGNAYLNSKRQKDAIGWYKKALKIDPENQKAAWNLQLAELGAGEKNSLTIKSDDDWDMIQPLDTGGEKD